MTTAKRVREYIRRRMVYRTSNVLKRAKFHVLLLLALAFILWYFMYSGIIKTTSKAPTDNRMKINDYLSIDSEPRRIRTTLNFQGHKLVHLDLKGAPPKTTYYKKLFPLLSTLGANGILVEYEDMFPYTGQLSNISALNAYTKEDVAKINDLAMKSKLAVIPLIQTFGHLEFVLKLEEFSHLREVHEYPQAICPTHEETLDLIVDMLDQIIRAHPYTKIIHIGADEVYNTGQCQRCLDTMSKLNWSKNQLILKHITAVTKRIKSKYDYMRVLTWDDQFRSMSIEELKQSHIAVFIEPVVWQYSKDVSEELGPSLWNMYQQVFPKVWIASAFKGATGSNQYLTSTLHHLQNHRSWLSIVEEYSKTINFQGIFLTGWQRYDHFAVLCELLPVAVPSLAMCLNLLRGTYESPFSPPMETAKLLHCEQPYGLMGPAFGTPKCHYPGGDILEAVLKFQQLVQDYEAITGDSRVKGWITDYNIEHSFSSPQYVISALMQIDMIKAELDALDGEFTTAMIEVYDNYTIDEWKETYLKPFEKQVLLYYTAKEKLLARTSWPRRPLVYN